MESVSQSCHIRENHPAVTSSPKCSLRLDTRLTSSFCHVTTTPVRRSARESNHPTSAAGTCSVGNGCSSSPFAEADTPAGRIADPPPSRPASHDDVPAPKQGRPPVGSPAGIWPKPRRRPITTLQPMHSQREYAIPEDGGPGSSSQPFVTWTGKIVSPSPAPDIATERYTPSRRGPIAIRMTLWLGFGVVFGLAPVIVNTVKSWMSPAGLNLTEVLGHGELFITGAVVAGSAIGELVAEQ